MEAGSIPACAFAKMSKKQIVWTHLVNSPAFVEMAKLSEGQGKNLSFALPNKDSQNSQNSQRPLFLQKSWIGQINPSETYNNQLQKLEIWGPLGLQTILIPSSIDLNISVSFSSKQGVENSWIQTLIIDIFWGQNKNEQGSINNSFARRAAKPKQGTIGTLRALILQMLVGVTSGFTSNINLIGVGYKGHFIPASSKWPYGQLSLSLGFGHSVIVPLSSNLHIDPLKIVNSSQGAVIPVSSNSLSELNNFVYSISKLRPAHKSFKGTGVSIS